MPAQRSARPSWLTGASVPSHWRSSYLKHLVRFSSGETITAESIEPEGAFAVYGANGFRGFTSRATHSGSRVLVGRVGALCGNVHVVSGEYWASEHALVGSTGSDDVDVRWLRYLLVVMDLGQYSQSSAQPVIAATRIEALGVEVPPLREQRAIADYLDRETARIDTLIEEQQRLIAMLRERRAAEIATAFCPPFDARLRYAIEFAQTGPFGTQLSADEYVEGGIPVINPSHITRGAIAPDPAIAVSSAKAQTLERHKLKVGDLVLGRKGDVDKCALVGEREAGFLCGSDSMLLRPGDSTDATFLWWFLQSPEAHSQLELWSVGSTVAGLNQTTIAKVGLPLPALDDQRTTAVYLDEQTAKIDELIAETERFIELSRERRMAVITAAVTGQIDVREVA